MMRRSIAVPLVLLTSLACEYDSACKPLIEYVPQLRERLVATEERSERSGSTIGLKKVFNADIAQRFLRESELLKTQLPAEAKADDLDALVRKLGMRRAAFEQALRDFLASDAGRPGAEADAGEAIPLRRGIEMSRNAMFDVGDAAVELCRARQ